MPASQGGRTKPRHRSSRSETSNPLEQRRRQSVLYDEIVEPGGDRGQSHGSRKAADQTCTKRDYSSIVKLLESLGFQSGNIYIGRTFRLASFALETEIHHRRNLVTVEWI